MTSAILYLGTCMAFYILAIPLRKFKEKMKWLGPAQTVTVLCLVLTMGLRLGAHDDVVNNLDSYGLYALVITIFTIAFSIVSVSIARRAMGIDQYGLMKNERVDLEMEEELEVIEEEVAEEEKGGFDRMTLWILLAVALGLALGYFLVRPQFNYENFERGAGLAITIELLILLVFVGLDLGLAGDVISNIKSVGVRVLVIPLVIEVGTLVGAAICGLFLPISLRESLAIGAGFGWYSLGAGLLMDAGLMTAGAISFMHNVMRELVSIIITPTVAKKIGFVEAVAAPGATGMDVCLPIITRSTSGNIAVYSFVSGFIISMSVPLVVPLFI